MSALAGLAGESVARIRFAELAAIAAEVGLGVVWVLRREEAERELREHVQRLARWQELGCAGEMGYMQRDAGLFGGFSHVLAGAVSVAGFVVPYLQGSSARQELRPGHGRIARYAWGRDYHRVLKKRLQQLVERVGERCPDVAARTFTDAVPILERALAVAGTGAGFQGKNTMYIAPGIGSFTFLGEVVWNVEVTDLPESEPVRRGCGGCSRCLDSCPTGAFTAPWLLDARRCISYLTIEKRTPFNEWERRAVGEWLFGCDICQEVCPFNHRGLSLRSPTEFLPDAGAGMQLDLVELLAERSDERFAARFAGTPLMRAGRARLLRNACSVLANTAYFPAVPALAAAAAEDCEALVRDAARQALSDLLPQAEGKDRSLIHQALAQLR